MFLRNRKMYFLAVGVTLLVFVVSFSYWDHFGHTFSFLEPKYTRQVIRSSIGELLLSDEDFTTADCGSPMKQKRITAIIDQLRLGLDSVRFGKLRSSTSKIHSQITRIFQLLEDELDVREFRLQLSRRLSRVIQTRLRELQNPSDCGTAPKLYCDLSNGNGLASGAHDLLWCFVQAFYSKRMLVFTTSDWHYAPGGWENNFRPLSQKCGSVAERPGLPLGPGPNDGVSRQLLGKLPADLADQLVLLGTNPLPWWYGQFLGFALQPNTDLQELIEKTQRHLGFKSPIIGVHIRRTDKIGSEATMHTLDEYMKEVETYFETLSLAGRTVEEKRVYLASDDPTVLLECRLRFPDYSFLNVPNISSLAGNLKTRYTEESVRGTLLDLFLLSRTDFIVCTFSSGFCRLAYEVMQYNRDNALRDVFSLDTEHFYAYVPNPGYEALRDWSGSSQDTPWGGGLDLKRGDILFQPDDLTLQYLAVHGKRNDGMEMGRNYRTRREGFYPAFYAAPFFELANYTND